jgi:hypothetical protein
MQASVLHLIQNEYCVVTSPTQKAGKAQFQQKLLVPRLWEQHKILHAILLNATGTTAHLQQPLHYWSSCHITNGNTKPT